MVLKISNYYSNVFMLIWFFDCTFYFIEIIFENTESIIVKIEKSAIRINRYFDYISAQITSDFLLQSKKIVQQLILIIFIG